jgi:hypothetical protein
MRIESNPYIHTVQYILSLLAWDGLKTWDIDSRPYSDLNPA